MPILNRISVLLICSLVFLTIQRVNLFIRAEVQVVVVTENSGDSILQQQDGVDVDDHNQTIRDSNSGMNSSMVVDVEPSTLMKAMGMKTCLRLREELGSDVVQGLGEEVYANAIQNQFSLFNGIIRPACVVAPRISMHVQKAMEAIFRDKVRYGVQSGGHAAMTGWNTVQDGVLIYFVNMKNITYDIKRNRVIIEPGIRWGEALEALEPYGVAVMGGRLTNIGTGLLLGGGISYLAPEHGWSSDAIAEMDVVLVNGKQVTATRHNEYSDLFRALKGGGNRFGIVTRYELEPIRVGRNADKNWYGGLIAYPDSSAEAILRATHKFVETNQDPKAAILTILGHVMENGIPVPMHTVAAFYRGSELPRKVFGEFLDIPSLSDNLSPVSYFEAAEMFGTGESHEFGERFSGSSFVGGVEKYLEAYNDWRRFSFEAAHLLHSSVYALTPILAHQIEEARKKGGNAINASGPYASVHWHNVFLAGHQQVPPEVELSLQWLMRKNPPSPGGPLDMNESDMTQNVYATYGDYGYLRRVYKKYDPTRFNVRYSHGPIGL